VVFGKKGLGNGAAYNAAECFAAAGTSAAAPVLVVEARAPHGVGVAGPVNLAEGGIVPGALVGVAHKCRNGGTQGFAFIHAGKQFDSVCFDAWRCQCGLAGPSPVEGALYMRFVQHYPRGAPLHHGTQCGAMAFTKTRQAE
jgi:hypothetical protein